MTDLSGIAVLKPRAQPHPDRYGGLREWSGPPQGVCWHTTEGGEGITSAEGLAGMMLKSKAAAGGNFAAYHYVVDADSIIPLCQESQEPYAQGGANDALISVCVTGKAGQTPEQWADEMSHPALLNMALITARIVAAYGIPITHLLGPGLVAGHRGICGHVDVRDAYHKTTHTDPGPFFPWALMLDLVDEIASPRSEPLPESTPGKRVPPNVPGIVRSPTGAHMFLIHNEHGHVKELKDGKFRDVTGPEYYDVIVPCFGAPQDPMQLPGVWQAKVDEVNAD